MSFDRAFTCLIPLKVGSIITLDLFDLLTEAFFKKIAIGWQLCFWLCGFCSEFDGSLPLVRIEVVSLLV